MRAPSSDTLSIMKVSMTPDHYTLSVVVQVIVRATISGVHTVYAPRVVEEIVTLEKPKIQKAGVYVNVGSANTIEVSK